MKGRSKNISVSIALILIMLCFAVLGGCSKAEPSAPDSGGQEQESGTTPDETAEISERAMQNFLDKIQTGSYVMNAPGFLKTSVCSGDLVVFDYEEDDLYSDFAVMSVNGEVFQGTLADGGIENAAYVNEGSAVEISKNRLPSCWLDEEISGGNIYNVFYNDTENPLVFVSYDDGVKNQVRSLVGYGQVAANYMHEIYLTLDAEDPAEAHLQAEVDDDEVARYYFDDIDITITFGGAQPDARAEAWMKEPVYPEGRTGWTEGDIFIFNSIFLPGYGEQAVPFMPFASYALRVDDVNFLSDDAVYIRDPHAEDKDLEDYIGILKQNGFEEHTENGEVTYRRLLREETRCYSSISLEYDRGLNFTAKKAYDFPKYEGLGEINGLLGDLGFAQLPETEALTGFTAEDRKWEQTESWLFFYDYKAVPYVTCRYSSEEEAMQYLDAYVEAMKAQGFKPHDEGAGEEDVDYYQSPDESSNFRWHFEEDGETLVLLYKAEKRLEGSEAEAILSKAGFPEIDYSAYLNGRDTVKFQKTMYGRDYDASVILTWRFDTPDEGEAFLDSFVAAFEAEDFMRVPPGEMGSSRTNCYINEEKGLGTAFDFFPGEDGADTYVYFDFRAGIDFNDERAADESGNKPILGWKYSEDGE